MVTWDPCLVNGRSLNWDCFQKFAVYPQTPTRKGGSVAANHSEGGKWEELHRGGSPWISENITYKEPNVIMMALHEEAAVLNEIVKDIHL